MQLITTVVKITFLGFLFYFCLQFFGPRWESLQLSERLQTLSVPWITIASILTLGYYVLGLFIWSMILRKLGSQPALSLTARAYVFSLLPKYIPGNIAAHGLRMKLASEAGVPVFLSMKSFAVEIIFALGAAAVIFVPGTLYYFPALREHLSVLLVLASALGLVATLAVTRLKFTRLNKFRSMVTDGPVSYVKAFLLYLIFWFIFGFSHWCLANALSHYSITKLPQLIVAVSASWALGFISIFAPAGLGVREAILYLFVANWMRQADIILFVTLSRLLMFGVEVFLTICFLLYRGLPLR